MRSLFSSGPPLVLALKTKPLAIVQASFQALKEMMTDIKRLRKKIQLESYENPLVTVFLLEQYYSSHLYTFTCFIFLLLFLF